ncbi:hypothetical protein TVAG_513730 [Trichomonas vaginalis G3]|uniref:Polycystin cation channel PKD1/PKD2 domain-containing protein n=2 Tax=Trichomonas vaginalis (strain ATCC PRA-98 / G3) TaxID=412133 RepID=A2GC90_TRIV3|nr:mucolipin family [Trichomonas vaginalis G3]EAX85229.1 hypothetical protein TVAG_513730 [Trichomonas vaginalis G3]KAI5526886.1 mucolipin family [Trichomonas vaginalis G3]|eukprot:XP_001298159.1 hypothetical protein [Trichomonas vaginalis G3]
MLSPQQYNRYTEILKIVPDDPGEEVKFYTKLMKNNEQFKKTDRDFETWKNDYVVPWSPLFDIAIVLLYVFFALTFQTTKMAMFHNFNTIFDNYFMGDADEDDDGLTYIYFKSEFVEIVKNVSELFFTFTDSFPAQSNFTRSSNLTATLIEKGKQNSVSYFCQENASEASEIASAAVQTLNFKELLLEVDYLIEEFTEKTESLITVKYSMSFKDVDNLGIIEWRSKFKKTEVQYIGTTMFIDALHNEVFPIAILFVDAFALLITISRFMTFIKFAQKYSKENYVSFAKSFLWNVNGWEFFNLFYQSLTLVTIIIYILIVDPNFGGERWLLFLLGCSAFIHSLGLFRYLKMKPELWMVARITGRSLSKSCIFAAGFIPTYIGFVFMGISFFGYFCNVFKGFLRTIKVLFSIFHSDIVMDTEELVKEAAVCPDWLIYTYIFAWTNLTNGIIINSTISFVECTIDFLIGAKWKKYGRPNVT